MPEGRPPYTLFDLPEKWKHLALEIYENGGSDVEVRKAIAIPPSRVMSPDLWDRFMEEEIEFSETVKEGRQLSQIWWESKGRTATFGGVEGFVPVSYIFNMKNRFKNDWRDKQDLNLGGQSENPVVTRGELVVKLVK